jgi:CheY-like chemotaxis protein
MPTCKTVLIVEDDEAIRETMQCALELRGYSVFAAANGTEGIDLLAEIPRPCVILLDLMMPVMDGWDFVAALERNAALAAIPVVVVTAFGEQAESIKASAVLSKPVALDNLYTTVFEYCGSPVAPQ